MSKEKAGKLHEAFFGKGHQIETPNITFVNDVTLWDYYAAHALTCNDNHDGNDIPKDVADYASRIADAMLLEREKRGIK